MRSTIQSPVDDHELPAGIVAEAQPSAESTVVAAPGVVFLLTGGASELEALHTVKWTRNGAFFPEACWRLPSSVTPMGVAFSLVTRPMALADGTVTPSPGVDETTRGAVLSIRIPVTTSEDVLPRLSETVARRS